MKLTSVAVFIVLVTVQPLYSVVAQQPSPSPAIERIHGIILSADPSTDLRNTTTILYVIKGGEVFKRVKVVMPGR